MKERQEKSKVIVCQPPAPIKAILDLVASNGNEAALKMIQLLLQSANGNEGTLAIMQLLLQARLKSAESTASSDVMFRLVDVYGNLTIACGLQIDLDYQCYELRAVRLSDQKLIPIATTPQGKHARSNLEEIKDTIIAAFCRGEININLRNWYRPNPVTSPQWTSNSVVTIAEYEAYWEEQRRREESGKYTTERYHVRSEKDEEYDKRGWQMEGVGEKQVVVCKPSDYLGSTFDQSEIAQIDNESEIAQALLQAFLRIIAAGNTSKDASFKLCDVYGNLIIACGVKIRGGYQCNELCVTRLSDHELIPIATSPQGRPGEFENLREIRDRIIEDFFNGKININLREWYRPNPSNPQPWNGNSVVTIAEYEEYYAEEQKLLEN